MNIHKPKTLRRPW